MIHRNYESYVLINVIKLRNWYPAPRSFAAPLQALRSRAIHSSSAAKNLGRACSRMTGAGAHRVFLT